MEMSEEVEEQRVEQGEKERKESNTECVHELVAMRNYGHNPTGAPLQAVWNIPQNYILRAKKLGVDSLTSILGALAPEFPSMPCKQTKHTLVVTEHPQTETREALSV